MDSEFQQAMGDGEEQGTGRTGKPGVLQSMGSRVGYDTATELMLTINAKMSCHRNSNLPSVCYRPGTLLEARDIEIKYSCCLQAYTIYYKVTERRRLSQLRTKWGKAGERILLRGSDVWAI